MANRLAISVLKRNLSEKLERRKGFTGLSVTEEEWNFSQCFTSTDSSF